MNNETVTQLPQLNRRKWWRWLLAVISVLVFVPYIYSRFVAEKRVTSIVDLGPAFSSSDATEEVSILIFNIAHGRGTGNSNIEEGGAAKKNRIKKIAQFLKKQNADIVVLNEVDFCCTWSGHQNQAEEIAKIAGYRFRGEQRNLDFGFAYGCWQFGNAVLSKFPLQSLGEIDYPALSGIEELLAGKKRGVEFRLKLNGEKTLGIVPFISCINFNNTFVISQKVRQI